MNREKNKVPTRFGTEVRFALRPKPAAPTRAQQAGGLEPLKERLLAERLGQTGPLRVRVELQRAAQEAAALAWVTPYPTLLFPELFAEKAQAAWVRVVRQKAICQRSRELLNV
jgi:hypothetical protein